MASRIWVGERQLAYPSLEVLCGPYKASGQCCHHQVLSIWLFGLMLLLGPLEGCQLQWLLYCENPWGALRSHLRTYHPYFYRFSYLMIT